MSAAAAGTAENDRLSPWSDRWANDRTGWHLEGVNEMLVKHIDKVIPAASTCTEGDTNNGMSLRWLVTLCGKTVDMAYLAKLDSTERVIGVDGVSKALQEFVQEHPELEISADTLSGKKIDLILGDFFHPTTTTITQVDVIWDRGSLVAIPPSMREDYVKIIRQWLRPGGKILLSVVDRRSGNPQAMAAGPPFSVSESQVHELYQEEWIESITKLEEIDYFNDRPDSFDTKRMKEMGLESFFEVVYLIQSK